MIHSSTHSHALASDPSTHSRDYILDMIHSSTPSLLRVRSAPEVVTHSSTHSRGNIRDTNVSSIQSRWHTLDATGSGAHPLGYIRDVIHSPTHSGGYTRDAICPFKHENVNATATPFFRGQILCPPGTLPQHSRERTRDVINHLIKSLACVPALHGCSTHKKPSPPRTLPQDYA